MIPRHDENGIVWPEAVAPFHAGIINLKVSPKTGEVVGVRHAAEDERARCVEDPAEAQFARRAPGV